MTVLSPDEVDALARRVEERDAAIAAAARRDRLVRVGAVTSALVWLGLLALLFGAGATWASPAATAIGAPRGLGTLLAGALLAGGLAVLAVGALRDPRSPQRSSDRLTAPGA